MKAPKNPRPATAAESAGYLPLGARVDVQRLPAPYGVERATVLSLVWTRGLHSRPPCRLAYHVRIDGMPDSYTYNIDVDRVRAAT